ncbi:MULTISPECIES: response regulator [Neobacillus]|uniref:Response regulator n=1 Tax=Neobacillus rhizophilus TaxID=2833579 RepID=A0A942U8F6_9BACI|nr:MULTISPECIES: response regulator [Neobacillus]MBS4214523.1 response regulator [Neobacillus rhizophilus]MBU8918428.1 response regulator [Bacillus sp. FJAT-29953]
MNEGLIKVMIVEDDETAAKIYEKFTDKAEGFLVVAIANTGRQALDMLNIFTPDLILLDVFLPDINGIDLLWEIRKKLRSVDVIMITAANDVGTVSEAIRGGAFSYILKPIMINKFFEAMEQFKETREKLVNLTIVEQEDVNDFFRVKKTREEPFTREELPGLLPKGIDKHTLKKVRQQIGEINENINAEEFSKMIGASHSTGRRYLEYLVSINELEVEVIYGTIGRPERRYRRK